MVERYSDFRALIYGCARKFGNNTAYKIKNKENGKVSYRCITFSEMKEEVVSLGKYFLTISEAEQRIVIIGKNSYEWMLVYLSALASNNVIIPLDNNLPKAELAGQLERAKADVVFYSSQHEEFFKERKEKCICTESEEFTALLNKGKLVDGALYDSVRVDADKMSLLLFTSGTSADSKAVMLSQRNITENVYGLMLWENLYETDVNMAFLPLHHAFGMTQVVLFMAVGMCNVFCEGLRIAKCLSEYRVSILVGVPRVVEEIHKTITRKLESQNLLKKVNTLISVSNFLRKLHIDLRRVLFKKIIDALGGGLRLIIVGAAAANPDVLKWFNDIGVVSVQGYGLTEAAPVVSAENDTHMSRGSIGFPLPEVEVKIVNPGNDGIGEIITRGKNIMLGYYKDEEATKEVLKDGWLYTGDMGYIDKKGYIYITGRKKNVIVLQNGKNVFPEELEALINECSVVKECVVYNGGDENIDVLCAKIVYDTSFEGDFEKVISDHIEKINSEALSYKRIEKFELTDKEMEKTTTLKIKRRKAIPTT